MAENDIYNSKGKYEKFVANIDKLSIPVIYKNKRGTKKYYLT